MNWKRLVFVLGLSLMLTVGSTMAAAAKSPAGAPTATLLVTGLEELQGSAVGPGGALFVTAPLTGSIWRVDPKTGAVTLFASGLPARLPGLDFIGSGVVDVAFIGGHHNRVLRVTLDGEITQVIAFDDIVPTGLAVRGNTIYMGEAGPIPHLPETSKVVSFTLKSPTATQVASGAGLIHDPPIGLLVDVEFGRGNTLYALLQGYWNGPFEGTPAQPNTGALVKVNPEGTFTLLVEGLNQPTSVEIIKNTAYVVTLAGEIWRIDNISAPPYGG